MKYVNRLYPYQVFGINSSQCYTATLKVECKEKDIILTCTHSVNNEYLQTLIKRKQASYIIQITCNSTFYRESILTTKALQTLTIPSTDLKDTVQVDFLVCASIDSLPYTSSTFDEPYRDIQVDLEKGDLIAYAGSSKFIARKSPEVLKSVSSFMKIDTDERKSGGMVLDFDFDKITILLTKDDYDKYQRIVTQEEVVSTLHSTVVLPALAEVIRIIKHDNDIYESYVWRTILDDLVEKNDHESPLYVAQKILDFPVNRSFQSLYELIY